MTSQSKKSVTNLLFTLLWVIGSFTALMGQEAPVIKGFVFDNQSKQAIAYATVALCAQTDSSILAGTMSNFEGSFELKPKQLTPGFLQISYVGYRTWIQEIKTVNAAVLEVPVVYLEPETIEMAEAIVTTERIKAKQGVDRTTFFVNSKIQDASNTGVDLLRFIPGVQVDFMQNVKLEGSSNILILVDGKERDKNFLNQLNPKDIDKVEVINTPGAKYDANVSGAINLIMKKDKNTGVSGNLVLDVPTRKSAIYVFPVFNLNLGLKKFNFYASYNGDFRYFDLKEGTTTIYTANERNPGELNNLQDLRQKNREQRISYGFDYFVNQKNLLNFYGYFGPYANETDGKIQVFDRNFSEEEAVWSVRKEETDRNRPTYYSLYYKHLFSREGSEISMDASYYRYNRSNSVSYQDEGSDDIQNHMEPQQNSYGFKLDYTTPLNEFFKIDAGMKIRLTDMKDRINSGFDYYDNILAGYGLLTFSKTKLSVSAGLRSEKSESGIQGDFGTNDFHWLPNAVLQYRINTKQNLKLAYARRLTRPYIYQLNPTVYQDDPYTLHAGNEHLKAELRDLFTLDYSALLGKQYLAAQVFYSARQHSISNLVFLNDTSVLESRTNNMGTVNTYGIQLTAALKPLKLLAINGYLKWFGLTTEPSAIAREQQIKSRSKTGFDFGMSTILSMNHGFTFSLSMQYTSPVYEVQTKTFNELLYFVSFEKTIKSNLKCSISFAPLFAREYTYRGLEARGPGFTSRYEGKVQLPDVPLGFKLSYQFNSGKKIHNIERTREMIDNKQKVGM